MIDNRFVLGVQLIVSRGLNEQSKVDINLNPTSRFTLPAGRAPGVRGSVGDRSGDR